MILHRNFGFQVAEGNIEDDQYFDPIYSFFDTVERRKLVLAAGKFSGDTILIAATTGSEALELPSSYDATKKIMVFIKANGSLDLSADQTSFGSGFFVVHGEAARPGICYFMMDKLTAATLYNYSASDVQVEYFMYELPDITDPDSFLGGAYAFGST